MLKKKLIFLISAAFMTGNLWSQRLPVQTFTTRDGLASNFITTIYQDSKGYLWIGTDEGISIFDGDKFKNIQFDDSKVWGYVNNIVESKVVPGQMLIATNGGGLIRYLDGTLTSQSLGANPLSNFINSVIEMDDGSLWCATDDGLYFVQQGTAEHFIFSELTTYPKFTSSLDGTIWCFDDRGLYIFLPQEKKILRPNVKDLPLTGIIHVSALSDSSVAVHVRGKKDAYVVIVKNEVITKKVELLFSTGIFTVLGPDQRFWIGTSEGLQMVHESGGKPFTWIYTMANGLPINELTIGYQDREQNIWFGSFGRGLTKLEAQQTSQFNLQGMTGKGISDCFDHLWIPTSHGLYELWRDSVNQWKKYLHVLRDGNESFMPVAIAIDSAKNAWITNADGSLSYFIISRKQQNKSTLKQQFVLNEHKGFPKALTITIFVDAKNVLWYCPLKGGLIGVNFTFTPRIIASFDYQRNTSLRDVRALYEDHQGNIWALGFDPVNRIIKHTPDGIVLDSTDMRLTILPKIPFRAVFQSSDGAMWFGSRYNGLFRLQNNSLKKITVNDGMISNQIFSLAETPSGGLLIGTQVGLMSMPDFRVDRFTSLQKYTQSPIVAIESKQSVTYAITRFELTMFSVPEGEVAAKFPPVLFTSLFVNGKERPIAKEIELPATENTITIDYTAIAFLNTGALRFQYKLEPVEEVWHNPTTNRSVTYANLSPGNYMFAVRALNQEGKPSEIPSILPINISSPLWMRWWFITLFIASVFGLLAAAERIRVQRLLEIEKIRSRIAADLHDDIGSGLTRIALLSDMIHRQATSEKKQTDPQFSVSSLTAKVGTISRELVDAMSDVVWSIDPKNSSMERLLQRVQTFAVEVCEAKEIVLNFSISEGMEKLKVGSDSIRAVLLVAKEALTNVVRHSNAKNVSVKINSSNHELMIEINDDGSGFAVEELSRMNGLTNMRLRIEKNNGIFVLSSAKGSGTMVKAVIPLPK